MGQPRDELLKALKHWREELHARDLKVKRTKRRLGRLRKAKAQAAAKIRLLNRELRQATSMRHRAVRRALGNVGTVEHPPGSNRGPRIDGWQATFGIQGQPWCGAFVGAMLLHVGVKGIKSRVVYTPYIKADALAGVNGFSHWIVDHSKAQAGDLALFDFPDSVPGIQHVGMLTGPVRNGEAPTVEGNTTSGNTGSQDNGGGVFARKRPTAYIVGYARPAWA